MPLRASLPSLRVLWLFAAVSALLLVLLVLLPLRMSTNALRQSATERVSAVNAVAGDGLHQQLESMSASIDAYIRQPELQNVSTEDLSLPDSSVRRAMHSLVSSNPDVAWVLYLDASGVVRSSEP